MKLDELNDEQIMELKGAYLCAHQENTSWGELAHADELVSMEQLQEEYGDVMFSPDDFLCSVGQEEPVVID